MICSAKDKGFTLIELAVVLAISGVLLGAAISMFMPYLESVQYSSSKKKEQDIASALASFAQMYGRLPCPADPTAAPALFGAPRNSGADGSAYFSNDCGGADVRNYIGIVPFRALGLTEENVQDGYKNFYTYVVNPKLTFFDASPTAVQFNTDSGLASGSQCTQTYWKTGNVNKNIYKAHVCCPANSPVLPQDINIVDARNSTNSVYIGDSINASSFPSTSESSSDAYNKGTAYYGADTQPCTLDSAHGVNDVKCVKDGFSYTSKQSVSDCVAEDQQSAATGDNSYHTTCMSSNPSVDQSQHPWLLEKQTGTSYGGAYSTVNTYAFQRQINGTYQISPSQFIAYALISHGHNGDGAFTKNGTQRPVTVAANAQENENENNDFTFVSRQVSKTEDNNYFDDIILWKTNDQLISQFGNNSCARP